MKRKIIIDTDPGHDDVMAIMLAIKSNIFDIQAITTVCGNSTIENTTRNARFILELLDKQDTPIYSGASRPLQRDLIQAVVHGKSGLDGIDPTNMPRLTGDAVEKMISIIRKNPGEIIVIALGPLTNIAQAMINDPVSMSKIKEIIIMGGAVRVAGNKNRVAEFNIFVDPEAAEKVFSFPVKITLVPLDACNHVQLHLEDFKKISNPILQKPLLQMVKPYIRNIAKNEGIQAAMMYDPLTVYYLINPKAARSYMCNIAIETKGELTRGMTVGDFRTKPLEKENVTVVDFIDKVEFRNDFIRILSKK